MSVKADSPKAIESQTISAAFATCAGQNRAAFIPFITAGYPDLESSYQLLETFANAGADIIEIGIPFSDPLADGTTVQHSSQVALEQGTTLQDALDLTRRFRNAGHTVPIVLMGYANPYYKFGIERLAQQSAEAGINGFIIADLPVEESIEFREPLQKHELDLIFMVAPTTTDTRLEAIAAVASGFIYCVSLTGTTGARDSLSDALPANIERIRSFVDLPLAVGFGISTPEHVAAVSNVADGVIVASAILNLYDSVEENRIETVDTFVRKLSKATIRGKSTPEQD